MANANGLGAAVFDDFRLADFEELRVRFRLYAGADAARVADGDRAARVIGHRPQHVHELVLILRLHVHDIRARGGDNRCRRGP
jgi:hypothetical protein